MPLFYYAQNPAKFGHSEVFMVKRYIDMTKRI